MWQGVERLGGRIVKRRKVNAIDLRGCLLWEQNIAFSQCSAVLGLPGQHLCRKKVQEHRRKKPALNLIELVTGGLWKNKPGVNIDRNLCNTCWPLPPAVVTLLTDPEALEEHTQRTLQAKITWKKQQPCPQKWHQHLLLSILSLRG